MDTDVSSSKISLFLSDTLTYFFSLTIKLLIVVGLIFLVVMFSKKLISYIKKKVVEHNDHEKNVVSFANISGDLLQYVIILITLIIGLYVVGFKSVYLILGATLATGYAFKELFQNLLAGVIIMTNKEFAPGDLIEVCVEDTIYFAKIDTITIRYTVLRKLDMTRVVIPNRLLIRVPVITFTAEDNVRLSTTFKLHKSVQLKILIPQIKKQVNSLESITEKDFTFVTVDGLYNGSYQLTVYFYFDPNAGKLRFRVISEVNRALKDLFEDQDIHFVYPHSVKTTDAHDKNYEMLLKTYNQYLPLSTGR